MIVSSPTLVSCAVSKARSPLKSSLPDSSAPHETLMHVKIRKSTLKHKKKTGYLTRQRTKGGRKTNARQRKRHGSF